MLDDYKKETKQVHEIVNKLNHFKMIKSDDLILFREYESTLNKLMSMKEFTLKHCTNPNTVNEMYVDIEKEYNFINSVNIYRSSHVSLLKMNGLTHHIDGLFYKGVTDDYYDFKELVEMVNAYYEVWEPVVPVNKLAFTWNCSLNKNNWKAYLFTCIRNYLSDCDVECDVVDLQKIVCLRDCEVDDA